MNPYLLFAVAMCTIVFLALAGTAYMAMYFNRRAKDDLHAALDPLANALMGETDVEEAKASGRFEGHLAEGRVASLPGGMGRVFQMSVIDGAGGVPWQGTLSRSKEAGLAPTFDFQGSAAEVESAIQPMVESLRDDPAFQDIWFRLEYDPAAGYVRLTRPMRTRRDIPGAEAFTRLMTTLVEVAGANRAVQGPSDSGSRPPMS